MATILHFPYRESRYGIWGNQTSTLNWCEEDYNITPYIAEFINTTTNLTFLYLAILGIRNCLRYAHRTVFILSFIGYLMVGLGSAAFHATMKYSMQLADELPMIYTTCTVMFAIYSSGKSRTQSILLGVAVLGLVTFITGYYLYSNNPIFHETAYALTTIATVGRNMYDMEMKLRPVLRKRNPGNADPLMKQMWLMSGSGMLLFLVGFGFWNVDNLYCRKLREWRHQMLLPGSFLLEGHGWWHIFVGIGAYYIIVWTLWLDSCLEGREKELMMRWSSPLTIPQVVARPPAPATAKTDKKLR